MPRFITTQFGDIVNIDEVVAVIVDYQSAKITDHTKHPSVEYVTSYAALATMKHGPRVNLGSFKSEHDCLKYMETVFIATDWS